MKYDIQFVTVYMYNSNVTNNILQTLKFSKEDIEGIRKLLAAIIHLGNVEFTGPKDGHFSRVPNQKQVCGVINRVHVCMCYVYHCLEVVSKAIL